MTQIFIICTLSFLLLDRAGQASQLLFLVWFLNVCCICMIPDEVWFWQCFSFGCSPPHLLHSNALCSRRCPDPRSDFAGPWCLVRWNRESFVPQLKLHSMDLRLLHLVFEQNQPEHTYLGVSPYLSGVSAVSYSHLLGSITIRHLK